MKRLLKVSVISLFAFLLTLNSFGQISGRTDESIRFKKQGDKIRSNTGTPVYSKMKTDTIGILELDYPEVSRRFTAFFPLAENQLWIKEAGSLYVSFLKKSQKVSAVFTVQGTMNYSIASIKASDIPMNIAEKIKTRYSGYSIFSVKEITVDANTIYQVLLESRFEYVIVRINNDEMEESKRVNKSL